MSFLFPSPPKPPKLPPVPSRDDEAVAEARRRQRLAARLRKGRASTILTSGQGVLGEAPVVRKTLLGQ